MGLIGGPSFSDLSPQIQRNLIQFAENVNRGAFRHRWELASAKIDDGKEDQFRRGYQKFLDVFGAMKPTGATLTGEMALKVKAAYIENAIQLVVGKDFLKSIHMKGGKDFFERAVLAYNAEVHGMPFKDYIEKFISIELGPAYLYHIYKFLRRDFFEEMWSRDAPDTEEILYIPLPGVSVCTSERSEFITVLKGANFFPCYKINCENGVIKTIGIWLVNVSGKQGNLGMRMSLRSLLKAIFLGKAILRGDNSIFIEAVSLTHIAKLYLHPKSLEEFPKAKKIIDKFPKFVGDSLRWKKVSELFDQKIWRIIEDDVQFIFSQIMGGTRPLERKLRT
ncbi:TPA: hypothetical protein H1005_03010 [archaeon]|uniref:Uncharacterized protein n=1 Tax=Candidatus Naiadarchaeum limnaeum TaxID=2756139 RepID=A0A832V0P8_9ARCH|nr:hypothetical protein [Candidatus Naiadarchaeales archaeon SRR2090153.bin1042]HIJ99950.1 hypothetical protein [Candidatus Naiadarchaeum limnaeum]